MNTADASSTPPLTAEPFTTVPSVPLKTEATTPQSRLLWLGLPALVWAALLIPSSLHFNDRLSGSMCCLTSSPVHDVIMGCLVMVVVLTAIHWGLIGLATLFFRRVPLGLRAAGPTVVVSLPVLALSAFLVGV